MKFIKFMLMPITVPIKILTTVVRTTTRCIDRTVEFSWKASSVFQKFLSSGPRLVVLACIGFLVAVAIGMV